MDDDPEAFLGWEGQEFLDWDDAAEAEGIDSTDDDDAEPVPACADEEEAGIDARIREYFDAAPDGLWPCICCILDAIKKGVKKEISFYKKHGLRSHYSTRHNNIFINKKKRSECSKCFNMFQNKDLRRKHVKTLSCSDVTKKIHEEFDGRTAEKFHNWCSVRRAEVGAGATVNKKEEDQQNEMVLALIDITLGYHQKGDQYATNYPVAVSFNFGNLPIMQINVENSYVNVPCDQNKWLRYYSVPSSQVGMMLIDGIIDYWKKRILKLCGVNYLMVISPIAKACLWVSIVLSAQTVVFWAREPVLISSWIGLREAPFSDNYMKKAPLYPHFRVSGEDRVCMLCYLFHTFNAFSDKNDSTASFRLNCSRPSFIKILEEANVSLKEETNFAVKYIEIVLNMVHTSETAICINNNSENILYKTTLFSSCPKHRCLSHEFFGMHKNATESTYFLNVGASELQNIEMKTFADVIKSVDKQFHCNTESNAHNHPPPFSYPSENDSHFISGLLVSIAAPLDINPVYEGLHSESKYPMVSVVFRAEGRDICFGREEKWLEFDSWEKVLEEYSRSSFCPQIIFFERIDPVSEAMITEFCYQISYAAQGTRMDDDPEAFLGWEGQEFLDWDDAAEAEGIDSTDDDDAEPVPACADEEEAGIDARIREYFDAAPDGLWPCICCILDAIKKGVKKEISFYKKHGLRSHYSTRHNNIFINKKKRSECSKCFNMFQNKDLRRKHVKTLSCSDVTKKIHEEFDGRTAEKFHNWCSVRRAEVGAGATVNKKEEDQQNEMVLALIDITLGYHQKGDQYATNYPVINVENSYVNVPCDQNKWLRYYSVPSSQVGMMLIDGIIDYWKKRILKLCGVNYLMVISPIAKACLWVSIVLSAQTVVFWAREPVLISSWIGLREAPFSDNYMKKAPLYPHFRVSGEDRVCMLCYLFHTFNAFSDKNDSTASFRLNCSRPSFIKILEEANVSLKEETNFAVKYIEIVLNMVHTSETAICINNNSENILYKTTLFSSCPKHRCLSHEFFGMHKNATESTYFLNVGASELQNIEMKTFADVIKSVDKQFHCNTESNAHNHPPRYFTTAFSYPSENDSHFISGLLVSIAAPLDINPVYEGLHSESKYPMVSVVFRAEGRDICFGREEKWLEFDSWEKVLEEYSRSSFCLQIIFFERIDPVSEAAGTEVTV
uniref:Uncharacterized protein n=1 Tax=Oryza punctata TaxID=4537 RepID=A0A0E0MGT9_ORYPU